MKIGAFAGLFAPMVSAQTLSQAACDMEGAELDSIWFGEHVMLFDEMEYPYPGSADGKLPMPDGHGSPDQGSMIAYLASQTKNLRFGTGISLITQRNPVYTAKEFATLDWLSGGRVDLGVGVGWCKEEVEACGYRWEDRGARCDDALELMIKLWRDSVTDHQGKHFQVAGARMDPKPQQRPHVPLIVGGFSAAALRRTARYGQGWLGFGLDPKSTEKLLANLDAALGSEGRKRADLDIVLMPAIDDEDSVRAFADLGVDRLVPMLQLGSAQDIAERIDHLHKLKDISS